MRIDDPELRRRINQNLRELADGTVARREAAARAARAARKEQAKKDKRRIKAIDKRLEAVRLERDDLQEWLDSMLLEENPNPLGYAEGMTPAQAQGVMEEVDASVNGCNEEIVALQDERAMLERMLRND